LRALTYIVLRREKRSTHANRLARAQSSLPQLPHLLLNIQSVRMSSFSCTSLAQTTARKSAPASAWTLRAIRGSRGMMNGLDQANSRLRMYSPYFIYALFTHSPNLSNNLSVARHFAPKHRHPSDIQPTSLSKLLPPYSPNSPIGPIRVRYGRHILSSSSSYSNLLMILYASTLLTLFEQDKLSFFIRFYFRRINNYYTRAEISY
jgi:hypothetical protein